MVSLHTAFFASIIATLITIRFKNLLVQLSGDYDLSGLQKFHVKIAPHSQH